MKANQKWWLAPIDCLIPPLFAPFSTEAVNRLLDADPGVDGIVCGSDIIARGVLDGLREGGRSVPDDVSVVGHNDMPLVDLIDPPLTTVRVAVEQMGRQAAQMLLELLGAPTQAPVTRMLVPRLIVRDSTARAALGAGNVARKA